MKIIQILQREQGQIDLGMPHKQIQKVLFFAARFLKKTSSQHRKKLMVLVVIALLSYVAKKRLRLAHLFYLAEKLTKVIDYLPLPSFPRHRNVNRYESVRLNSLMNEVMSAMNIQQIKAKIKQKQSDWNQLKLAIMSGTILSLILYNVQSFYFIVQNKYQADFRELNAIETFERMMGDIRRKFVNQIPIIMEMLQNLLSSEIQKIDIKAHYSLNDYFGLIDQMVAKVFSRKYLLIKEQNQLLENSFYRQEEYFKVAQNYFLTPLEYIHKDQSKFDRIKSKITKITSKFNFRLFRQVACQISRERFEWTKIAYRIPLKKSLSNALEWPNKQSQMLSKLVINQMDQAISSVNFSTILYQFGQYNSTILKNRIFLHFSKKGISSLRAAQSLSVFYKLIKEQILISLPQSNISDVNVEDKREKFYEAQIFKAFKLKQAQQSKLSQSQSLMLVRSEQQKELREQQAVGQIEQHQIMDDEAPELILSNRHLQELYQSKQLAFLIKEFQIKYFNQRSKVVLNPISKAGAIPQRPGTDDDDIKKLLNLLGDNEELNKKE